MNTAFLKKVFSVFIKDNKEIIENIKQLCSVLLEQEDYRELKTMISEFEGNENAIDHYTRFIDLQHSKEEKEKQGLELTSEETQVFDQKERAIYSDPVIRKYLFARKEFQNLQLILNDYFEKTIKLERLPNSRELTKVTRGCGSHNQ